MAPPGGNIPMKLTEDDKAVIALLNKGNLKRGQIDAIVNTGHIIPLEPRQISNIIAKIKSDERQDIILGGGDMNAIIRDLERRTVDDIGSRYFVCMDPETNTVTAVWWALSSQIALAKEYSDILINDNTYNTNNAGYSVNIGVIIDGRRRGHNAFYSIHS
jgi:hypothetical protein